MNKTESAYAAELETRRRFGNVDWYKFEAVKLRLADSTFYTPDFMVMLNGGEIQCHEVKGHWEDDARVKIKVAASLYPFRFIAVTRKGGEWQFEKFSVAIGQEPLERAEPAAVAPKPRAPRKRAPGANAAPESGVAYVNGRPVSRSEALALIRGGR